MKLNILTAAFTAIFGIALAFSPICLHADDMTTNAAPSTAAPAKVSVKKTPYKGTLTAIDTTANTVTVQIKTTSMTMAITAETKILKDKKPATLADFAVGSAVTGSYTKDATGKLTAASLHGKTPVPATTTAAPATPAAQ